MMTILKIVPSSPLLVFGLLAALGLLVIPATAFATPDAAPLPLAPGPAVQAGPTQSALTKTTPPCLTVASGSGLKGPQRPVTDVDGSLSTSGRHDDLVNNVADAQFDCGVVVEIPLIECQALESPYNSTIGMDLPSPDSRVRSRRKSDGHGSLATTYRSASSFVSTPTRNLPDLPEIVVA